VLARPLTLRSRCRTSAIYLVFLAALLFGLLVTPANAASITPTHSVRGQASTPSVNATIYLTTSSLDALFQGRISALVPSAFNSTINNTLNQLPTQDRGWAGQMISTLIQPSATLTGLSPQQNGLATSIQIALYPGDPQPINATMLVSFQVLNSSTVQVSAQPLNGSPTLVSGPIATIPVPIGQLHNVAATPNCGLSALGIHLQIPLALTQGNANVQLQTQPTPQFALSDFSDQQRSSQSLKSLNANSSATNPENVNSYVEIPASSLASIGTSIGTMSISGSMTAKNIQIGVQGRDLTITSAIYDSFWGQIGTAVTTVAPTVSRDRLAVNVLNTSITIFGIFTFPYNSYNQQIQQALNARLNNAFAGKFNATQAQIGPNSGLPCAANNSLVLAGTTSIG
jgi:hypothetical protein